jgi:hypothetical protein
MDGPKTADSLRQHLFVEEGTGVFAVLDGASVRDLLTRLYDQQPEFCCLYRGELKPDLAEVAPYLVRLEPGSEFTQWLLEHGWGKHWGIFALAPVDLQTLRRHFRRFLVVYDPDGKPLYFRYYDPRVLRVYLPTCNADELAAVFGPVESCVLEDEDPGVVLRFRVESGSLKHEKATLGKP